MSMSPNELSGTPGIFLMRRHGWFHRVAMGIPEKPTAGDRGAVRYALLDLIDAAGGLEFSRGELLRVIGIAQEEYSSAMRALGQQSDQRVIDAWGGATIPAVYFAFFEAVTWARTVIDRFQEPLKEVVQPHDRELWKALQRIRSESGGQVFDDARTLAGVSLHWYSPPHAGCGAKIVNEKLIYPVVDNVDDGQDFRNNLNFSKGRHAEMLVEEYWKAVCIFIDRVLDEFYPK
jgi:hypothetical protein